MTAGWPTPSWKTQFLASFPRVAQPPIHHVVSAGSLCFVSKHLLGLGLKRFSGPFDWVFSAPDLVAHCIDTDFADFLAADALRAVPGEPPACHHLWFEAAHGLAAPMFNHHDPTRPETRAYVLRCIDRFRRVLDGAERTLLVCLHPTDEPDALVRLDETLARRGRNVQFLGITTARSEDGVSFGLQRLRRTERSAHWRLQAQSPLVDGLRFESTMDNLMVHRLLTVLPFDIRDDIA